MQPSNSAPAATSQELRAAALEALEALSDAIACVVNTVPMSAWSQEAYNEWVSARARLEKALEVESDA